MEYIDLSYEIENNMAVYPGDEEVSIEFTKKYDNDGYTYSVLKSGMHVGTHLDCPMHLTDSSKYISEYPLENFIGEGVIIDVRGKELITLEKEYEDLLNEKEIVILFTGYEKYYGTNDYYENHPIISEELVDLFIEKKIRMVGFDMPSPDKYPFNIHKKLLNNRIFILENLCNLERLAGEEDFKVIAFPLKIKGEGSMVRAVAIK